MQTRHTKDLVDSSGRIPGDFHAAASQPPRRETQYSLEG